MLRFGGRDQAIQEVAQGGRGLSGLHRGPGPGQGRCKITLVLAPPSGPSAGRSPRETRVREQPIITHRGDGQFQCAVDAGRGVEGIQFVGEGHSTATRVRRFGHVGRDLVGQGEQSGGDNEILSRSVNELNLSVRARKALALLNIQTLGDVVLKTEAELMGVKNFGMTSLLEIKEKLTEMGLGLRTLDS